LREVAEVPSRGLDLFRAETEAAGDAEQSLTKAARPIVFDDLRECRYEPERAGGEGRFGLAEAVVDCLWTVAANEGVVVAMNMSNGRPPVLCPMCVDVPRGRLI
jgi:hypothetical protein